MGSERKADLRGALQREGQAADEELAEAIVTKYAAVVEWMAPDGNRWLHLVSGDAGDEDEGLHRWDVQGMFFNVLYDPAWQPDGDDE